MTGADDDTSHDLENIRFRLLAPALEFLCWVVVLLAPLLRWVNGPPVSRDQAVMQISLVTLAVVGALSLRIYNYMTRHRRQS